MEACYCRLAGFLECALLGMGLGGGFGLVACYMALEMSHAISSIEKALDRYIILFYPVIISLVTS